MLKHDCNETQQPAVTEFVAEQCLLTAKTLIGIYKQFTSVSSSPSLLNLLLENIRRDLLGF